MKAAILFANDGYLLDGPKLMGRQAAGNGFLRAAVLDGEPLTGFGPGSKTEPSFHAAVKAISPTAESRWIPAARPDLLAEARVLYRPDPVLGPQANLRQRVGMDAFSICGVTHTLSSSSTVQYLANLATEPVAPWDAVVCTSNAAHAVVSGALEAQVDYLRWRLGAEVAPPLPLLPIIPLGVHTEDFAFTAERRADARGAHGIAADEVVVLFAGRLALSSKAHPQPMLQALQRVHEATGLKLTLLVAGQAPNQAIAEALKAAYAAFSPDIRVVTVNGADHAAYRNAWAAADIFMSLADSVQETFGITPVEAMAAGLPVIVSDWSGYRDTVRDGVDGFRIPTIAPPAASGAKIAQRYEDGQLNYDWYLLTVDTSVAADMTSLIGRLTELATNPDLRRRMGAAGAARARETYEWSSVFKQYRALWAEQDRLRLARAGWNGARGPASAVAYRNPFDIFRGFATHSVGDDTLVELSAQASADAYAEFIRKPLISLSHVDAPLAERIFAALAEGPRPAGHVAETTGIARPLLLEMLPRLAKMDFVVLRSVES